MSFIILLNYGYVMRLIKRIVWKLSNERFGSGESACMRSLRCLYINHTIAWNLPPEIVYPITMAGDIVINGVYYAMASIGNRKNAIARGGLLGLAAGVGAVYLPKYLGLTNAFSDRSVKTSVMTLAIYTLGGLVSGALVKYRR